MMCSQGQYASAQWWDPADMNKGYRGEIRCGPHSQTNWHCEHHHQGAMEAVACAQQHLGQAPQAI